ncbi:hypothetical protein CNMCM5623_010010 [Aspergillus felis]|uniref:DUF7730 domain-containing protein n=1 Tax=Aspergillus felis TaxID=1287682 RepID=A0A8H6Q4H5_9EURO|nr:hypothetical protein CNMCM5623_010010 [Aspergillus felis]
MRIDNPISFLDLPPELRIQIYKLLLGENRYKDICLGQRGPEKNSSEDKKDSTETRGLHPAVPFIYPLMELFLTNKQIYLEAVHMFYTHSIFEASIELGEKDWQMIYKWLVMIGPQNRKNLRRIKIRYCCLEWAPILENGQPGERWIADLRDFDLYRPYDWENLSPTGRWVEYISPTIEKIFKLLGECRDVIVTIDCCAYELGHRLLCPELYVAEQGTGYPNSSWFHMSPHTWYNLCISCEKQPDIDFDDDLYGEYHFFGPPDKSVIPDLVELYRTRYGGDSISVLWKGHTIWAIAERSWRSNVIERSGWDIIQSEYSPLREVHSCTAPTTEMVTMHLKRRSKKLPKLAAQSTGDLEADINLCMRCSGD